MNRYKEMNRERQWKIFGEIIGEALIRKQCETEKAKVDEKHEDEKPNS